MQRSNLEKLLDDLEFDPFVEEDDTNSTRIYETIGDDDDFEVVAAKLNAKRTDDDPILAMRAMLNGTPYAKREEKHQNQPAKKSSLHHIQNLSDDETKPRYVDQKISLAQKKIKSELEKIRNIVKTHYKKIKTDEKIALSNTTLRETVSSDQRIFVDYLLCEMAGIPKFNCMLESKEDKQLIMQSQLNPEYLHFKDVHYNKLVVCLVTFIKTYNAQGFRFFTQFSALQFAFKNYLYENIKINQTNIAEIKQNQEPIFVVTIPDFKSSSQSETTSHIARPEEHLSTLEQLYRGLQNLTKKLGACLRCIIPLCCFFSQKHTPYQDIVLDDGKNNKPDVK